MDFAHYWFQAPAGAATGKCLRFRRSQALNRAPVSAGNRKTWTWSGWVKRGRLSRDEFFFNSSGVDDSTRLHLRLNPDDTLEVGSYSKRILRPTQFFRDSAAWYHIVVALDTTQATASNRLKIYINGQEVTSFSIDTRSTDISQNAEKGINTNTSHVIGGYGSNYFSGYMGAVHFIDGQALAPTDFGEYNADGVWVPKKVAGVTYGNQGWYLDFSDPADIGADRSGNGNNWTPTGFELTNTTSRNYDWVEDSPTDNYQTINPLTRGYVDTLGANRGVGQSAPTLSKLSYSSTFKLPLKGKWYTEWSYDTNPGGADAGVWMGVCSDDFNPNTTTTAKFERAYRLDNGKKLHKDNGTGGESAFGATCTAGDHIGVAVDMDKGHIWFAKNNVWQGSGNPATGANPAFTDLLSADIYKQLRFHVSIRNRVASFWDGGIQGFVYTPPAGFSGLSTANLPDVAITNPSDHVQIIKDSAANILTNCQATFPNGFYWIMERSGSPKMRIVDSVRGGTKMTWNYNVGGGTTTYQQPSSDAWAMCFNTASAPATNNAGTISANVSANPLAGISQIHYTGNGTSGATVGHGLNGVDVFVVVQDTQSGTNVLWASAMSDHYGNNNMQVNFSNKNNPYGTNTVNNVKPSGTVITLGTDSQVNENGKKYIILAFQNVSGFSNFVKYVGAGGTNNTFLYHGFTPLLTLHKATANGQSWHFMANVNKAGNPVVDDFATGDNEYFNGNVGVQDFVSNGSKLRSQNQIGDSGATYFQWAFAEHPFGGSNISPAPAR